MIYHKPEDYIITYPNSIMQVADLKVGMRLFGPDSKPRKILSINKYDGSIYKINSLRKHELYLKEDNNLFLKRTHRNKNDENKISIISYLDWKISSKTFKQIHKLYSVQNIVYNEYPVTIEPYFLGVLLGDGSIINNIGVTTEDPEIVAEINRQAEIYSLHIRECKKKDADVITYFLAGSGKMGSNRLINDIRDLGIYKTSCGDKTIPRSYLFNSRNVRLELLAGLLDTDGHKSGNCCYEFITKSNKLSFDICLLSRSLGFSTSASKCIKTCQNNFSGEYNRVYISGDTNLIPIKIERKKSSKRMQKKNIHMIGFNDDFISENSVYYGITVNKDNLYIDNNFVTLCGN